MNELINTLKGIVLLDEKTYHSFLTAENTMKRGIMILLACFLIIALPTAVEQLINNVQPFTEERAQAFQDEFFRGFDQALPFMPQEEEFQTAMEQFKENFAYGVNFGVAIDALPRPLPRAAGGFLQAFGGWLSAPFAHLGAWLAYAIWVLLFAKAFDGFGGVNRFLGLTALYAMPNLLGFFSFIPFLGGVISFVGMVWGWVVYARAVEVSQEFTTGKAILMMILPILLIFMAAFLLTILTTIGIISTLGQIGS